MNKRLLMMLLCCFVTVLCFGCDDGDDGNEGNSDADADTDSDSDSDSDADSDSDSDGDFPGDCESIVQFIADGTLETICSSVSEGSRCYASSDGNFSCLWYIDDDNLFSFKQLESELLGSGVSYIDGDSFVTEITFSRQGETFISDVFEIVFETWDGPGGIASGTFTANLHDSSFSTDLAITDGQFYAPIVSD